MNIYECIKPKKTIYQLESEAGNKGGFNSGRVAGTGVRKSRREND